MASFFSQQADKADEQRDATVLTELKAIGERLDRLERGTVLGMTRPIAGLDHVVNTDTEP